MGFCGIFYVVLRGWNGMDWVGLRGWIGMGWVGLDWIGWIERVDWIRLGLPL